MRHSFWIVGAVLGVLTSLPLIALSFLGQQFAGLPFVPFDLFDWLARRLPGGAITLGIDAIVRAILALRLGPISGNAKLIEQAIALALVVIVGAIFGVLLALVLRRGSVVGWRAGSIGGFALFLLAAAMTYDLGFAGDPALPLAWLAVLLMGWGALLGNGISATLRPAQISTPLTPDMARRAVLKLAGGSVAVALAAWGVGRLLQGARNASGASRSRWRRRRSPLLRRCRQQRRPHGWRQRQERALSSPRPSASTASTSTHARQRSRVRRGRCRWPASFRTRAPWR